MPSIRLPRAYVPRGTYQVQVISARNQVSKKGNQMILLRLSIEGAGRHFSDHLVFTKKSLWKVWDFLIAMGQEVVDQTDVDFDPSVFVGHTALALVDVEQFKGQTQNKIEKWLPIPDAELADGNQKEAS